MDAQMYGPYVAWKVPHHGEKLTCALEVWDWKRGILIWHGHFSQLEPGRFTLFTYTFIDMEYLAVALKGKVAVYRFATSEAEPACPYSEITGLPSVTVVDTHLTTSLNPTRPLALFWPDPALKTIAVHFHMFESAKLRKRLGESLDSTFVLLIPRSTFLEHIERTSAIAMGDVPCVFPWRNWGERESVVLRSGTLPTRHEPHVAGFYSKSAVVPFGSRIALFTLGGAGEVRLTAVDVNPLAAARRFHELWGNKTGRLRRQDGLDADDLANLPCIHTTFPRTYMRTQ
ncbi:hypothetical protein LXA43DRAFT_1089498 [Ganoderma leucocontextum]|nr:hypothetical protein LXA43DRAFT_1089498 [Ganoderma leucocontextum]